MTHEQFQNKLSDIPNLDLAEKAQSTLSKLCVTGGKSFTMSVPPRLDDTDMIFSEVIKRFEQFSFPEFPNPDKAELLEALEKAKTELYNHDNLLAGELRQIIQKHKQ